MANLIEYGNVSQVLTIVARDPEVIDFVLPGQDLATLPEEQWLGAVGDSFVKAATIHAVQDTPHIDALGFVAEELEKYGVPDSSRMAELVEGGMGLGRVDNALRAKRREDAHTMLNYGRVLLQVTDWRKKLSERHNKVSAKESLDLSPEWERMWGREKLGSFATESLIVDERKVAVHFKADSSIIDPDNPEHVYSSPLVQASGNVAFRQTPIFTISTREPYGMGLCASGSINRVVAGDPVRCWDRHDPTHAALHFAALTEAILLRPLDRRGLKS